MKRLLVSIENKLKKSQFKDNHFSFGIKEYLEIPGMEYQRDIGILGLDVTVVFKRKGKRVKERKWKKWLVDNVAEEPVIYDSILKNKSTQQIKLFLNKKGYFDSTVKDTVITRKKRVRVIYSVKTLSPYLINSITYSIKDTALSNIVFNDTTHSLIKKTFVFDQSKLEKERERIAKDLHDSLGGLLSTVKLQFDNVRAKMNGSLHNEQYDKATDLPLPFDTLNK